MAGLGIDHFVVGRVFLFGEHDDLYITVNVKLPQFLVLKPCLHLLAAQLVVVDFAQVFGHKAARGQRGPVGGAVIEVDIDLVTENLPFQVPDHCMTIHVDDSIGFTQLQRVTDALHVAAVEPHLIEGTQHSHRVADRVVGDIVDERAQGVGMQVDGVLLGKFAGTGSSRDVTVVGIVVMVATVAVQDDLVAGVGDDHVATSLTIVVLAVVIHRVAQ